MNREKHIQIIQIAKAKEPIFHHCCCLLVSSLRILLSLYIRWCYMIKWRMDLVIENEELASHL